MERKTTYKDLTAETLHRDVIAVCPKCGVHSLNRRRFENAIEESCEECGWTETNPIDEAAACESVRGALSSLVEPPDDIVSKEELDKWFAESVKGGHNLQFVSAPSLFRAVFLKRIHCCFSEEDANDAWVTYEMTLPFAPAAPMIFTDRATPLWSAHAQEVQWDGELFVVYTTSDRTIYDAQANRQPSRGIAIVVNEYLEMGWRLLGYGASPPIKVNNGNDGRGTDDSG